MKTYWVCTSTGELVDTFMDAIKAAIFNMKHHKVLTWRWKRVRL